MPLNISSKTVYLSALAYIIFETAFHETMVSHAINLLSFQLCCSGTKQDLSLRIYIELASILEGEDEGEEEKDEGITAILAGTNIIQVNWVKPFRYSRKNLFYYEYPYLLFTIPT